MSALAAEIGVARGAFRLDAAIDAASGITAVVGPSGAGKSTLLMALLGDTKPLRGRITLGERVLFDAARGIDAPVRSRRVGIVFQDALLFPHMTALGNVAFACGGREEARDWLERVDAGALAARRPPALSGGERQRVALARALAARPEALLLDEPFSALDPAARASLGALIVALQRESAVPFLHVTHDPGEALRVAGTTIALEAGRVVASGPTVDVLSGARGRVASLGSDNWLRGVVLEDGPEGARVDANGTVVITAALGRARGDTVVLALPAEDVLLATGEMRGTSARNVLAGTVVALDDAGGAVDAVVATPTRLRARVTRAAVRDLDLAPGRNVWVLVKASAFRPAG